MARRQKELVPQAVEQGFQRTAWVKCPICGTTMFGINAGQRMRPPSTITGGFDKCYTCGTENIRITREGQTVTIVVDFKQAMEVVA